MNHFSQYPYQNYSDYNLDWILKLIKGVNEKLSDYLENSVITFADPITWDITEQYPALTCVVDSDGTAYLSRQPVPAGISLTNDNYWTPIFNYDDNINDLRANIAPNEGNDGYAQDDRKANSLVWVNSTLYKTLRQINAGDRYLVGDNITEFTVADMLNLTYSESTETLTFPNGQYTN